MRLGIDIQLLRLALSAATGLALGIVYDMFRALRRRFGADALFDILYALTVLYVLFALGMSVGGGALHIFMAAFAALGFALYIVVFSKVFLPVFQHLTGLLSLIFLPVKKGVKFFADLAKNVFSNLRVWFTMNKNDAGKRGGSGEIEAAADRQPGDSGIVDLCGDKPCKNHGLAQRCRRNDGAPEKGHRSRAE